MKAFLYRKTLWMMTGMLTILAAGCEETAESAAFWNDLLVGTFSGLVSAALSLLVGGLVVNN